MLCQSVCRCPGGQASVVSYDMLVAADASRGGHLVMSALAELQDRQAAHKHPTAAATHHHSHTVSTGPAEMEYMAWHDMPSEPELTALLGKGASTVSRCVYGLHCNTVMRQMHGGAGQSCCPQE